MRLKIYVISNEMDDEAGDDDWPSWIAEEKIAEPWKDLRWLAWLDAHPYPTSASASASAPPLKFYCAALIRPHLYIGDCTYNEAFLNQEKIEVIIDCTIELVPKYSGYEYHKLHMDDTSRTNITEPLKTGLTIITNAILAEKNVLVHCAQGISRSPTIVIHYLMKTFGLSMEKALAEVRSKWDRASPNKGFLKYLALQC